jgi:hypothetical protein
VALALIVLTLVAAPTAQAEKRIALVIGNGAYVKVPKLPNPTNDSAAMAGLLRKVGFDVFEKKQTSGRTPCAAFCATSRSMCTTPTSRSCSMPTTAWR